MLLGRAYIRNGGVYQLCSLDVLLKLNCVGARVVLFLLWQLHVATKRAAFLQGLNVSFCLKDLENETANNLNDQQQDMSDK